MGRTIATDTNATKISEQKIKGEKHDAILEYAWDDRRKVRIVIDKA
jgi:hypothetical protein